MFSCKHFEAIAEIIKEQTILYLGASQNPKFLHADDLVRSLAGYFEQDNPRFDRDKFIAACIID